MRNIRRDDVNSKNLCGIKLKTIDDVPERIRAQVQEIFGTIESEN